MMQRDISKKLSDREIFETALLSTMAPTKEDKQFLWPDEQSARAFYILVVEYKCPGFFTIWRKMWKHWCELSEKDRVRMNDMLIQELACHGAQKGTDRASSNAILISQLSKEAKSGNLEQAIIRLAKSFERKTYKIPDEAEVFICHFWTREIEIGDSSFPPLMMFSAEGVCDLMNVALGRDMKPDAVRKIMHRKLRLSWPSNIKVSPKKLPSFCFGFRIKSPLSKNSAGNSP